MEKLRPVLKTAAVLGSGAALGVFLFVLVTPGEQRTRALLQDTLPEGNPQRQQQVVETKKLWMDTLREAAQTHENVAWRKDWTRPSGGRTT